MTDSKTNVLPRSKSEDKAERTTRMANEILDRERQVSDAKVARLKALRLSSEADAPAETAKGAAKKVATPKVATPAAPRVRRKSAAALRTLALQDAAPGVPAKKRG